MTMLVRSGAVWFGIMLAAILNGAARDMFFVPLTAAMEMTGIARNRPPLAANLLQRVTQGKSRTIFGR